MESELLDQRENENKIENQENIELNFEEYLINLIKEKDSLASQGKYLEAEIIRKRINEIKDNTIAQNKRELKNKQINEMEQLEENFNLEIKALNDFWDNEFNNFQSHYAALTNSMDERHQTELLSLKEYIEDKFNKNFKFPKEYLDLKTCEMNLVKQERYVEAHSIKVKCDAMEKSEIEKHMKIKDDNFALKSENLIKQQTIEKSALAQKMNVEYEEMAKVKQTEIDKIISKYKNKKFDLETKQGKEKNLHQNENLLKATIFNSNLDNFINHENLNFSNKPINKPASVLRFNSIIDVRMNEIGNYSKNSQLKDATKNGSGSRIGSKNKLSSVGNANDSTSNRQLGHTNKSQKLFNYSGTGNYKIKQGFGPIKNLQYSSAQN